MKNKDLNAFIDWTLEMIQITKEDTRKLPDYMRGKATFYTGGIGDYLIKYCLEILKDKSLYHSCMKEIKQFIIKKYKLLESLQDNGENESEKVVYLHNGILTDDSVDCSYCPTNSYLKKYSEECTKCLDFGMKTNYWWQNGMNCKNGKKDLGAWWKTEWFKLRVEFLNKWKKYLENGNKV